MIGTCDSCLKFSLRLIRQTNFGVTRDMCERCCKAANEVERKMTLSPVDRRSTWFETAKRLYNHPKEPISLPSNWLELYLNGELDE